MRKGGREGGNKGEIEGGRAAEVEWKKEEKS